ncbi:DUF4347 domain-containing protein [uncultured Desulfobulbus sp.]|uniref:DUF4347 domain-containing protein n=1 Tax=uncultured Desulfobulbus sp. TaxID=239745 RepID=UPI0029C94073|nr:DUF4347 domain-containing protein [uncultured Desulfobulbus sp.]
MSHKPRPPHGGLDDVNVLISGLPPGATYFILDPATDGIVQMANIASGYNDLTAIHILSHGSQASLNLGSTVLNQSSLAVYSSQLSTIGNALSATGDLLLYGCNVAQGATGQDFIEQMAAFTGADVAASTDLTGSAVQGGDWVLEASTGPVETAGLDGSGLGDLVLGMTSTPIPLQYFGHTSGEFTNRLAFAALKADGSVVTWGDSGSGGDSSTVASSLAGVQQIYSTGFAFAALKADGSVVTWGDSGSGGDSSTVASFLTGVQQIYSTEYAFAALKADGSVVTWGWSGFGGDSSTVASSLTGVQQIYSTGFAFAALKADGSVVTWGDSGSGGDSSTVASSLAGVQQIYSTGHAFAALKADGSVVTWGDSGSGGDSSTVASSLTGVQQIYSNMNAFAALKADGSVVTWGMSGSGGDSSAVASFFTGVQQIYSTGHAFAALKADGSLVTWGDSNFGGDSSTVTSSLTGVQQIYSTEYAFAALKADGSVVTWGYSFFGGDSSAVASSLTGVQQIYSNMNAFAALKADGSVVTWGKSGDGGDSSAVASSLTGVQQIYSTGVAFAALKADGSVVTWGAIDGGDSSAVQSQLVNVVGLADISSDDDYSVTNSFTAPDTGILSVQPVGTEWVRQGNGTFIFSGNAAIGLKGANQTMLAVSDGTYVLDGDDLTINGTFISIIDGVSRPLFSGQVSLSLSEADGTIDPSTTQFRAAGLKPTFTALNLGNNDLRLQYDTWGLPEDLISGPLSLDPGTLVITTAGPHLGVSGNVEFPGVSFDLFDIVSVEATDWSISYDALSDQFAILGGFKLKTGWPVFPAISAELTGDGLIIHDGKVVDVALEVTLDNFDIKGWGFNDTGFSLDTGENNFTAQGTLSLPFAPSYSFSSGLGFTLSPFELDSASLEVTLPDLRWSGFVRHPEV